VTPAEPACWSDILPASPRRAVIAAWALMAALNLAAGLVIATWPERQSDLDTMRRWGRNWAAGGAEIYARDPDWPDYPPHAIILLSPLGLLPDRPAVVVWAGVNLCLAVIAPLLALRYVSPRAGLASLVLPWLMFLCWGGLRNLLQFTLLALVFALLAIARAERWPVWSGVLMGLALMKPQVAAPFWLWAVLTRRFKTAATALGVVFAGCAIFLVRVQGSPLDLVRRYVTILRRLYLNNAGQVTMVGLAELRPLISTLTSPDAADAIAAALAVLLLAFVCIVGVREARGSSTLLYSAPPLAAIWSLLTFYHLTYGFVVLLPAAALLLLAQRPDTRTRRRRLFGLLQIAMMVDAPGLWRRFGPPLGVLPHLDAVLSHVDRVVMLLLFVGVGELAVSTVQAEAARGVAGQPAAGR